MKNKPHFEFSPLFNKRRKAAPSEIKKSFLEAYSLFLVEPFHPALRNHPLKGKYAGFRSIDITGDWRALYKEEAKRIIFVELGTHAVPKGKVIVFVCRPGKIRLIKSTYEVSQEFALAWGGSF